MSEPSDSLNRLIDDLQSDNEFARAQAAFALGMLGAPAVEPLVKLLGHSDHDVRLRSAWALGVIGQPALEALLALANNEETSLRIEAIRVLGVIGEARALNHLFLGLTDPDPRIAHRSAVALGKIGDPRAFHPLLMALHHPSPDVRYAATHALTNLHIPDAIGPLEQLASEDTSMTSWGASIAEAATRAAAQIASARPLRLADEFSRVQALLQNQSKL